MKKYLAIYYAPAEAMQQMAGATEEQKAEGMKGWFAWKDKHDGNIQDMGSPLMPAHRATPDGKWSSSKTEVTGYSIVTADNDQAAQRLFEGHPHLAWAPGCSIEISEFAPM